MVPKSKYTFPVMLLGDKCTNEPEQIDMSNFELNMDGDNDDMPVLPKHNALQKVIDEYSENSSIENGSLCEMNCIPCYAGDKRSQSYSQKIQYFTTVGKDECPRIFDFNHYASFNEKFNNMIPRKQRSLSGSTANGSYSSQLPAPQDYLGTNSDQTLMLNNNLNVDNTESYFSDASVETNTTLNTSQNESTYYIKTYADEELHKSHHGSPKPNINNQSVASKVFHIFNNNSIPINTLQDEAKYNYKNEINLMMTPITKNDGDDSVPISEIVKSVKNLKLNSKSPTLSPTYLHRQSSKLKISNVIIEDTTEDKKKEKEKEKEEEHQHQQPQEEEEKQKKVHRKKGKDESKTKTGSKSSHSNNNTAVATTSNSNSNSNSTDKKHRSNSSKYDFVKVLVYLSGEHYYVLSRFLISRMLTATQVDYSHAVRIALDLKKHLVDCNELELSQKKLEKNLFNIMKQYGYNEKNIVLYKLLSAFYRERIPMIILISGPRCVGKSTLATKLAERLNLPNIVKTDAVYDLMCSIFNVPEEDREPIWYRNCSTDELLEKYEKDCELVKKGVEADIKKAFTEGKSIIIEGTHVNHILHDFVLDCVTKFNSQKSNEDQSNNSNTYSSKLLLANDNPCNAIILPFYLDMEDKKRHKEFLSNQMMKEVLINNQHNTYNDYFMMNDFPNNMYMDNNHLCEFESKIDMLGNLFRKENSKRSYEKSTLGESKAFKYINVDPKSFQNTLDLMHNEVLNKIQEKFNISE